MNSRIALAHLVPVLSLLAACGTITPAQVAADITPAELLSVEARYERVSDGRVVGTEMLPTRGATRRNLSRDLRVRLSVVAADGQSGVASIRLAQPEAIWNCITPGSNVAQQRRLTLDGRSDAEQSGTAPAGMLLIRAALFTLDPFPSSSLRLVCGSAQDASELTLRATVDVSNGKGLVSNSGAYEFIFVGRPATLPAAAAGGFCGSAIEGRLFACPEGLECFPRQSTTCSGWWIFRSCERIETIDWFCQ